MNTTTSVTTSFEFTEEMKGYLSQRALVFEEGYRQGKQDGHFVLCHLTIHTSDLDDFLASEQHACTITGYVEADLIGGHCSVEQGFFNLFVDTADQNRRQMRYRLFLTTAEGKKLTLTGVKQIQDNPGLDLWADTTTLFTNLFLGHIEESQEAKAKIFAAGIVYIEAADFAVQLTTFRTNAPTVAGRIRAFEKFGSFFLGSLWAVYKPKFSTRISAFERQIPIFTTSGVKEAEITTHPFTTADRLGLSLLRFKRRPCQDVVVLIPGLTAASDMFIMPENYNLVSYLLDHGFTDIWTMDGRISNRYYYNLRRNDYNVDDLALYDHPAAIETVRKVVGPDVRIHVICHCFGALSFAMSLFGKAVAGVRSVIANGVALTPRIPWQAKLKLMFGPFVLENVLGIEYLNPYWRREGGFGAGKVLAHIVSGLHRECDSPECHMLSFMWGYGFPVLYKHENLHDITHQRIGDLFGGVSVNYYRHVLKMVNADNTAVKYQLNNPKYRCLPDDYFQHAASIETPVLFVAGQDNQLFLDSNRICYERLQKIVPDRHQLHIFPNYGHADVIIGKQADQDIFPRFVQFLEQNRT